MLCLSRARRYGARNSNPSDLLTAIASLLPGDPSGPVTWPASITGPATQDEPTPTNETYSSDDLDTYLRCPRQHYYQSVLGLSRRREDSAYVEFHRCVYRVLRWMAEERASGQPVDEAAALTHLAEVWEEQGPHGHAFEELYRISAAALVRRAIDLPFTSHGPAARPQWEVPVRLGRVSFVPNHVEILSDGSEIVERLRTGRPTKSETGKDIYGLYAVAARDTEPRVPRKVQVRYLSTGQVEPLALSAGTITTRLRHYDDAIGGILRKDFPPRPNDHVCPRCPHYFICPIAEDS